MKKKKIISYFLTGSIAVSLFSPAIVSNAPTEQHANPAQHRTRTQLGAAAIALSPLIKAIIQAEGGREPFNAVNRGYAGDTPGGAYSVLGRNLTSMSVGQVMHAQGTGRIYTAGAVQFIPGTLRSLVRRSGFDRSRRFDEAAQQELAVLLIKFHRPAVWDYVTGEPASLYTASLELAREWACIGHPADGRSYYAGLGGNRAAIPPSFVQAQLLAARGALTRQQINL